ncbi:SDR family NAD(P)-dependent oxidoreductase [Clostridium sp. CM028]|uniref:SDR family NAD(P)-dependent oxidoreductase n=1 Tax=Clostridium sp. CM028 TaxID=2851575 RepID=UPI001C6E0728|nr:SDR family NAD(P)-dependent oxidoreductase [Clostridium sp. CM028]MBW9147843.1 SDR family NAD(P)-dependent oxidoreductase [Clostridium sp. CM028]WLC61283.1 SDR family NAD(P)-dependent oxidoreductase [Clostridium sp. CM028]
MNFKDKNIILTGASSGIGNEVLKRLSVYNANVIAVGRNVEKINNFGAYVIPYSCDVSNKEEMDKLFEYAIATLGHVDIFIANAGFAYCEEILEPDWGHIEDIFKTNVISPIYAFEKMKKLNKGKEYHVAITCSAVSKVPLPGYSLYCSTKSAIDGFGRVHNYEIRDKGRLSLIYPIATSTNFFKRAGDKAPVPWPVQTPDKVAESIIKGIEKNKKSIYPSKAYAVTLGLNRILPFLYPIYARIQAKKFIKWIENKA